MKKTSFILTVCFGAAVSSLSQTLPDLIIWGPTVGAHFEERTFLTNDCEVMEGCATPGTRRLLRFATETRNVGTADLVLGNPVGNPLFVFDPCHHHYHFEDYVDFRLVDADGAIVGIGKKIGFALVDGERWDTTNGPASGHFDESYQGIQRGWSDLYDYLLPCQYVDITDIPAGTYTLELEVDPHNKITELNESNNVTRVSVNIPANIGVCPAPPPNDNFNAAQLVPYRIETVLANTDCASREANEPRILNDPGGRSVWFRWTAPYSGTVNIDTAGSDFDTFMALYTGTSLENAMVVAANDDGVPRRGSRIVTNVTAGTVYSITVDGYYFANAGRAYSGNVVLNINPNANDFFADSQTLSNLSGAISGTTLSATKEPGEPNHAGNPGGHSIWYSWTAAENGPMIFDASGSQFDTLLAIYTGTIGLLTPVSSAPDATSRATFDAVAGTTYFIAVDGRDGQGGICALNWQPTMRLTAPSHVDGSFEFTIFGHAGDHYVIEISPDLQTWTSGLQITNASGSIVVSNSLNAGAQFYRVRSE